MQILLTNDDGFHCEGIQVLLKKLKNDHDVWVVAPDSERSGTSHSLSILHNPCKVKKIDEQLYTCSGMPVDCVVLAHLGLMNKKPDLVISGINKGPNLGTDLIYSGTAAAARQASMYGIPSIAVSLATYKGPFYFENAADYLIENLDNFVKYLQDDTFLNINIPNSIEKCSSFRFSEPSLRSYGDSLLPFHAPDGSTYYFLKGGEIVSTIDKNSDYKCIQDGIASLSRIVVPPIAINPIV